MRDLAIDQSEKALETAIERDLLELGYVKGFGYNRETCLDHETVLSLRISKKRSCMPF